MQYHEVPYKSADELRITEEERIGLIDLVPKLVNGVDNFRMNVWCDCIRGNLEKNLGHKSQRSDALVPLYCGVIKSDDGLLPAPVWEHCPNPQGMANSQHAATAVVRFLSGA